MARSRASEPVQAVVPAAPLWRRLGWMALIWAGSVAALGVVAGLLRLAVR